MSAGATSRQDPPAEPRSDGAPEATDSDQETELGSIVLAPCPFCGATDLIPDGSTSEPKPGQRLSHAFVTCSACHAQGPRVQYTPYVDGGKADGEALRLWKDGIARGSVRAWSTSDVSPTPYIAKMVEGINWDAAPEEHVLMSGAAQGRTETGSIARDRTERYRTGRKDMRTWAPDDFDGARIYAHSLYLPDAANEEPVDFFGPDGGPHDPQIVSERVAALLNAERERGAQAENRRAAAVRRADKIAAERDHQAAQVARLTQRVRDLEAEAEVLARQVTDLTEELDKAEGHATFKTDQFDSWRKSARELLLPLWGDHPGNEIAMIESAVGDLEKLRSKVQRLEHDLNELKSDYVEAFSDLEVRKADREEVESIAPSNFDRLVIGDPVMTPAGVKGQVVGFSRWIDVEVQGRRGTPSTLSFTEDDVTPVTEVESASGSEHCGEQAAMDAGSVSSSDGGGA